ncbi:MAG: HepT-like ribonuclease domain-containing protein [Rubrivivax sp.]
MAGAWSCASNRQTLAESSQRLSSGIKGTEPLTPWRELAGFRNVIDHGYLGVDLGAVWLVIEQDCLRRLPSSVSSAAPPGFVAPDGFALHVNAPRGIS